MLGLGSSITLSSDQPTIKIVLVQFIVMIVTFGWCRSRQPGFTSYPKREGGTHTNTTLTIAILDDVKYKGIGIKKVCMQKVIDVT